MRGEEKRNKYRILTGGAIEDESPAKSSFNPRISSVPCTQLDNSSWLRRHWPAIPFIRIPGNFHGSREIIQGVTRSPLSS